MNLSLSFPLAILWFAAPDPANAAQRLIFLHPVDLLIVGIYFAMVLGIGFYLKRYAKSGEGFFLAGREMTAWVAGLSFISANLGALELMGWAAATYQYGILAAHWYWIGAIPAILFLGPRHDAVLLHFQDPLRSRLPASSATESPPAASPR